MSNTSDKPALPEVDFSREILIVAASGSGGGESALNAVGFGVALSSLEGSEKTVPAFYEPQFNLLVAA